MSEKGTYWFFLPLIPFALGCQEVAEQKEEALRPNILFVMTDDHAQKAISSYGSDLIQTPNIDRFAQEGIRFANSFVTNSICAPVELLRISARLAQCQTARGHKRRSLQTNPFLSRYRRMGIV